MTDMRRSRLARPKIAGELGRFAIIGVASTLTYLAIYSLLRTAAPAEVANVIALALTTLGNTTANRRLTFGVRERRGFGRDQLGGFAAFGAAVAITSGAIALLGAVDPGPSRAVELAVLVAANGLATIVRFVLLRTWIVRGHEPSRSVVSLGRPS